VSFSRQNEIKMPTLGMETGFKYTSLELHGTQNGFFSNGNTDDETSMVLNSAFESFCLLIFKPSAVDLKRFNNAVPRRFVYTHKSDMWYCKRVNP
jgi:hypothetical protein